MLACFVIIRERCKRNTHRKLTRHHIRIGKDELWMRDELVHRIAKADIVKQRRLHHYMPDSVPTSTTLTENPQVGSVYHHPP